MNAFKLNSTSLKFIQADTGMDSNYIANTDIAMIDSNIEKRAKCILEPSLSLGNLSPRGSVYLMLRRFFTDKFINRKLARIKA